MAQMLRHEHFERKNGEKLDRQLRGIQRPLKPLQKVIFGLPEQRRVASILGNLNKDLPEEDIVRRKVDAKDARID